MRKFSVLFALIACLTMLSPAFAQFSSVQKSGNLSLYHTTVGTSTAAAIPSASVSGNLISFKICNDAVNGSSTYLIVGQAADAATDGVTMAPGSCFECLQCKPSILKSMKVKGQGSSNGYSVIQYKQ